VAVPGEPDDRSAKHGNLVALLARVEAAVGPDRDLDHAIWRLAVYGREFTLAVAQDDPKDPRFCLQDSEGKIVRKTVSGAWRWEPASRPFREGEWVFDAEDGRHYHYGVVSGVSASLDAALAFVERCGWRVHGLDASIRDHHTWTLCRPSEVPNDGMDYASAAHADIRLALLAALLKALIAEAASPE
jgi:hypothetical protein